MLCKSGSMNVGALVKELDHHVPCVLAEEWDRCGLIVGNPAEMISGVYVTLDATAEACAEAVAAGANVLLTHHPPFLDPPAVIIPGSGAAGTVEAAVRLGVSVIALHTNLDRAPQGASALAECLGLTILGPLEQRVQSSISPSTLLSEGAIGLGRVCEWRKDATAEDLAGHVSATLGAGVRVWGDPGRLAGRVVTANGSAGSLIGDACAVADTLVAGEVRYHDASMAVAAGLVIIEAGHDATEWPLVDVLGRLAAECVPADIPVVKGEARLIWFTMEERHE